MTALAWSIFLVMFLVLGTCAQAAFAASGHDGQWVVSVVSETDACKTTRMVPIQVNDGRVTYAGLFGARATGLVQPSGKLNVRFSHRDHVVNASGTLGQDTGRGSWKSPTKDCSGSWVARKG